MIVFYAVREFDPHVGGCHFRNYFSKSKVQKEFSFCHVLVEVSHDYYSSGLILCQNFLFYHLFNESDGSACLFLFNLWGRKPILYGLELLHRYEDQMKFLLALRISLAAFEEVSACLHPLFKFGLVKTDRFRGIEFILRCVSTKETM